MLEKLYISKSGYYDYLKRKLCNQKIRKAKLAVRIREIHKESKEIYRAPKITRILQREGHKVSKRFVGKLIKKNNIKAHYIKPYTKTTKDYDYSSRLHNILYHSTHIVRRFFYFAYFICSTD